MSVHDERTLQFYSSLAPTYVSSGKSGASRHIDKFLEALRPNSRILELGCGGGRDARAMLDAGHDVDVTDGTPEIANKAAEFLQSPVRVMRFEELDTIGEYDAVWANASLLHVPRSGLPSILSKIHRALKQGGIHHATYKGGGKEGRDKHGRYFNYLSSDEVAEMYEYSGHWEILTVSEYLGSGYDPGVEGPWIALMARKPT